MISLAGLSATYPGYEAAQDTTAKTELNQTKARDAAIKLLGQQVLGATLAGSNGPQAPAPGQASVPAPRPAPVAAGVPPPSPGVQPSGPAGPAPQPPAPAAPAAGGASPVAKMTLQQMTQQILQTAPGVAGHPEVLLAALNHAKSLGLLDSAAEAQVDEIGKQHTMNRVAAAKDHLKAVQEAAKPTDASQPPAAALKPNTVTTFANGQKWTLGADGQPKQVM